MINVQVKSSKIVIKGHAGYANRGKDIVCSSVSSIVTTSVNAIILLDERAIEYSVKEGLVTININKKDETTKKLLDNMINLLVEVSKEYPKNVKVERE